MKKTITTLVLGLSVLAVPQAAEAESAPNCSSTVQIGNTAYMSYGGQTFASVKQFKGCNKNWAYLYVWQSWRDTHSSWSACVAVDIVPPSVMYREAVDTNCGSNQVEIWSHGADTLTVCTAAGGMFGSVPQPPNDPGWVYTDVRC